MKHLLVAVILVLPVSLAAQDDFGPWLRVIQPRVCAAVDVCAPRSGLIWDSSNVVPRYPEVLKAAGIGGDVEVSFRVFRDGAVDPASVRMVRRSHGALQWLAIGAVRQWRFGTAVDRRPSEADRVRLQLLFAHEGLCRPGDEGTQRTAWATDYQLVVSTCTAGSWHTQSSALPDSVGASGVRGARPVTLTDSLAVARALRHVLGSDRALLQDGSSINPRTAPWQALVVQVHEVPGMSITPIWAPWSVTIEGLPQSAIIIVAKERCDPRMG